jgi:hypothetical protein
MELSREPQGSNKGNRGSEKYYEIGDARLQIKNREEKILIRESRLSTVLLM